MTAFIGLPPRVVLLRRDGTRATGFAITAADVYFKRAMVGGADGGTVYFCIARHTHTHMFTTSVGRHARARDTLSGPI